MEIALCYESVLPARGGCETYIGDLSRRLAIDGHTVHLLACRWDATALPSSTRYHRLDVPKGPRFLRPWRFASACEKALAVIGHDVSIGFDKTWGQDVLYPQGGLHAASSAHNIRKHSSAVGRFLATLAKRIDPAARSFARLERKQYCESKRPTIVVNSRMVRGHFETYYGIGADQIHVIPSAIDPARFIAADRPRLRHEWRHAWGIAADEPAALFVAMNYRLKGLEPLLHSLARVPANRPLKLIVVGNPRTQRYQRLARRLGVTNRVVFHGFLAETRHAYFAADFLVHPTFYDPCSLVVLEALACGLPIITSRFNGAAELMQPPHEGLVVSDPHDHARLAECLVWMLDPARRMACSTAARQTASRWTFEHHYQQLLAVLTQAAAHRAAA
jgi:UDP-glucose:(heptosyl)LPS alpha-1,3-glucosyltransferase